MELKLQGLGKLLADNRMEKGIAAFRDFYSTHLMKVANRKMALQELSKVNQLFAAKNPAGYLFIDKEYHRIVAEGEAVLKKHFTPALLELYKKSFRNSSLKEKDLSENEHFLVTLLAIFTTTMEHLNESHQHSFNYQKNLIAYTYSCLSWHGLHPDILKRDPEKYKRFNLLLHHTYRSRKPLTEKKILLTYEEFLNQFIKLYVDRKPIKFGGKLIPFERINEVNITTTLLQPGEIGLFALKNNFSWTDTAKDFDKFISLCQDETETYHPNPYDKTTNNQEINYIQVMQAKDFLITYPDAKKLYDKAIANYDNKVFQRNVLDDLRLSLELLLKKILGNNKSLENQLQVLGKLYKSKGASDQITNMFHKILDYYNDYQNSYIKHNDKVKSDEIEFMINLTTAFMIFFIKGASL